MRQGLLNALIREIAPGLWLQGGTAPPRVESFAPAAFFSSSASGKPWKAMLCCTWAEPKVKSVGSVSQSTRVSKL